MSKAERIITGVFTIVGVSVSYSFSDQIQKLLQAQQPTASAFTVSIETSTIIVVPILVVSAVLVRSLSRRNRRKE